MGWYSTSAFFEANPYKFDEVQVNYRRISFSPFNERTLWVCFIRERAGSKGVTLDSPVNPAKH